jgi:DNA-binding response OmpR family regulator
MAAEAVGTKHVYEFGPFELDVLAGRLLRDGEPIALTPKAFDLLRPLVENHGRLLEKGDLMRRLTLSEFLALCSRGKVVRPRRER